jgi:hypothetical protein
MNETHYYVLRVYRCTTHAAKTTLWRDGDYVTHALNSIGYGPCTQREEAAKFGSPAMARQVAETLAKRGVGFEYIEVIVKTGVVSRVT